MTSMYPKVTKTADPRVRIAQNGARDFRTEVQDEAGADWSITGPVYLTRAEALLMVDETVSRHFGEPTHDRIRSLMAQVERLTAEKAELADKLRRESDRATALYVDGDRREQRALALLPDCEAHRRELQYLRHCVSWYWHSMNDSEEARHAIVGALSKAAEAIRRGPHAAGASLDPEQVVTWLEKAVDKQNRPLRRTSYPSMADCLRSAHGDCDHGSACGDFIAEVVEALGLVLADQPAKCKPAKSTR